MEFEGPEHRVQYKMGNNPSCKALSVWHQEMRCLPERENDNCHDRPPDHAQQKGRNSVNLPPQNQIPLRKSAKYLHTNCSTFWYIATIPPILPLHLLYFMLYFMYCLIDHTCHHVDICMCRHIAMQVYTYTYMYKHVTLQILLFSQD